MIRVLFLAISLACVALPALATEAGWALLRDGGHVVLLRHAMASGTADPENVDPEDCRTQRNLTERGKLQARKMGALFAARAAPVDAVLTSRYCRARDTAALAFRDSPIEEAAFLDPMPADAEAAQAAREAILAAVSSYRGSDNKVLVTHLETIQAMTGAGAREGEALIVTVDGDRLHVLARIIFN